jgi:hypothetical protein
MEGRAIFQVVGAVILLAAYTLIVWVLVKAMGQVMGDSRRGVRTTSYQIDTAVS